MQFAMDQVISIENDLEDNESEGKSFTFQIEVDSNRLLILFAAVLCVLMNGLCLSVRPSQPGVLSILQFDRPYHKHRFPTLDFHLSDVLV